MSKVSDVVVYVPSEEELPHLGGIGQAAIVIGWDDATKKANLIVFPNRAHYTIMKEGVVEGTVAGTFQQPASR